MSLRPLTLGPSAAAGARPSAPSRALLLLGALLLGFTPLGTIALAWISPGGQFDALKLAGFCAAAVVFLVTLLETRAGIAFFILAAGLSPEMGGNLRLSDFVFALLCFAVVARAALGRTRFSVHSPFTGPTVLTLLFAVLSVYWGAAFMGREIHLGQTLLILMKRAEYLVIFLVVISQVKTRQWADRLLAVTVITMALAVVQGFAMGGQAHLGLQGRVMGYDNNYNTFAGYLVLHICLVAALLFATRRGRLRTCLLLLLVAAVTCLFFTYSREGYIMLATSLLFLGGLRYRPLLVLILAVVAAAPWILPAPVIERVGNTVEQIQNYETDGAGGNGLTARVRGWEETFQSRIMPSPLLGVGVGSVEFMVDNEYVLRLAESGILGLLAFLWLLWRIGRFLRESYRVAPDPRAQAVAGACLAGFLALLIQGGVAAAFNTTRTMEPFYLLLGLVWVYRYTGLGATSAPEVEVTAAPRRRLVWKR